jgi:hypothetical protein
MWKPADKSRILKDIYYCELMLSLQPSRLKFWEHIRIEPEKWIENTVGKQGGGFWVVGMIGKKVIYYNDIEEGYNLSSFINYGEVEHYYAGQAELHEKIEGLYQDISGR